MEELLDKIPEERRDNSNDYPQGFTLRYSPLKKMWICGYGQRLSRSNNTSKKHLELYIGTGYAPIEALDDFISNKLKNHKFE